MELVSDITNKIFNSVFICYQDLDFGNFFRILGNYNHNIINIY